MTMQLIIGNKAYSSWSLRGWLAAKQAGLPFEALVVPMYDDNWAQRRTAPDLAPGDGKIPILWDGDVPVWDSLAIVDYLNDKTGNTRFWPADPAARALARSMAAEMHAGYVALRSEHTMNVRRHSPMTPSAAVTADLARIAHLWLQARSRFGGDGDFLFGAFGAADIMFAPVVTRIVTYALPMPRFVQPYIDAVTAHPFMQDWLAAAHEEPWVIERYEG
jgi:glutathione S-transferase